MRRINIIYLKKTLLLLAFSLLLTPAKAESYLPNRDSLQNYIETLSSELFQGRFPGTQGDSLSALYIAKKMESAGLVPLMGDSFLLPFELNLHREVDESSTLHMNGRLLERGAEYAISSLSPSVHVKGSIDIIPQREERVGEIAFVETSSDSIKFMVTALSEMGYSALLYYDSLSPIKEIKERGAEYLIPVLSLSKELSSNILNDDIREVSLNVSTQTVSASTFNVAGISPGESHSYVMVGAHYDHLGLGEAGSGSRRPDTGLVHYGADDNASGVAAILELARLKPWKVSNMEGRDRVAIVAFGAEERGLIGSSFLVDTLMKLNSLPKLMVNLDMVGRLRENKLQIGGVGTFAGADSLLSKINRDFDFELTFTYGGSGASDHSSFYAKKIPVLYFTTGVHTEYHTPSDTPNLINYDGLATLTSYLYQLLPTISNSSFEPGYIQMQEVERPTRHSHRVSFGLIPDFTYEKGDGFKIGVVSDGGAAQRSGMQEGDIIVEMNGKKIANIYDYMAALGELKPKDEVEVTCIRDEETIELLVKL